MWFSSIASIRARSPRKPKRTLGSDLRGGIFSPRRHRRRSRTGCDQACGRPTLSVEKPLVEKRRAAVPRTCGIISTERVGRLHAWLQMCDCAGSAVVKMRSLAARAVPPASVARLLAIVVSRACGAANQFLGRWCAGGRRRSTRARRRHCRPSLRRKSARRGAGSVEPGTQVLEGSPAPQKERSRTTHGTRTRCAPASAPRDSIFGPCHAVCP